MRKNLLKSLVAAAAFVAAGAANAYVINIGGNDVTFDQIDLIQGHHVGFAQSFQFVEDLNLRFFNALNGIE